MKKFLYSVLVAILMVGCIHRPDFLPEDMEDTPPSISEMKFPDNFNFNTSHIVNLSIKDEKKGPAKYLISYTLNDQVFELGGYLNTAEDLDTKIVLPTAINKLNVTRHTGEKIEDYEIDILGDQAKLIIDNQQGSAANLYESFSTNSGCVDRLYAVNTTSDFFEIDVTNTQYAETALPNLPGGSIADALDQENDRVYINIGKILYTYDIATKNFNELYTSNPFNGNYPRLEYKDGFLWMSKGAVMYKVDAATNQVKATYSISGFVNSNGGGDLAFASDGQLYLACFSGLYKFTDINDVAGTATLTRISAENFPYELTSMAIDRQDRIFVGTNNGNSHLIEISKEDGAYQIVKTFNKKINDLTAWKCDTTDLSQTDTDGDGVIDELDDHPNDSTLATDVFTPSELGYGSYAFEDMWPNLGDYDFNDLMVNYRYTNMLNSANNSVRLKMNFVLKAVGARIRSGFGIELDVDPTKISSVSGHSTLGTTTTLDAKGLETGQAKAVIIVFNDTHYHMQPAPGEEFVNTDPNESIIENVNFEVVIEFTEPIDPTEIGSAPFNPFIFSSGNRSHEIHLSGKMPTTLATNETFGNSDDDSNIGAGKTYQTVNNLPWAIHIIHDFRYPIEGADISTAYNKFTEWGESNGTLLTDWYSDNSGYRNTSKIYINN